MKISIITPNYNYGKYISKTIESVITQDYSNYEHIIVDDGSTDDSCSVVQHFISQNGEKIKLIKQINKGQSIALNKALNSVSGDIICWINSDDYYEPNIFSKIIKIFEENDDIDAVFGDVNHVDHTNKLIKKKRYLPFNYNSAVFLGFGRCICSNTIFWRRKISEGIFFNENLVYSMDADYWSKILINKNVYHVDSPIANWRQHKIAKTTNRNKKKSAMYTIGEKEYLSIFLNAYKNLPISNYINPIIGKKLRNYYRIKYFLLKFVKRKYDL